MSRPTHGRPTSGASRRWPCGRLGAVLLVTALVTAACGSARSEADIAAAAGVGQAAISAPTSTDDGAFGTTSGSVAPSTPSTSVGLETSAVSGSGGATPSAGSIPTAGRSGGPTGTDGTEVPAAASGEPIKLGNIGDYNGLIGAILGNVPTTLQVWAHDVNTRGGIGGRPVEIISANANSDPAKNASLVRDLVENQGVVAFVSNMDPLSGSGGLSYLEEHGIPVFGGDGVTERWNQSPVLFPVTTGLTPLYSAIVRVGPDLGKPKTALLYCVEADFICGKAKRQLVDDGDAAKQGAQITYTAQVSIAQPNFTAECLQSQRSGADTIIALVDANSLPRIARDCQQQNYHPLLVTGSIGVSPALEGLQNMAGVRAPITTFPWVARDTAPANAYVQALATYAPDHQPTPDGSIAWTSALLFERVAGGITGKVTSESLLAGLGTVKGENLGGASVPLTYHAGQPTEPATCYFVVEMNEKLRWEAPQGSQTSCL